MRYKLILMMYLLLLTACTQEPTAPTAKQADPANRRNIALIHPPNWQLVDDTYNVVFSPVICIAMNDTIFPASGMPIMGRGVVPKCTTITQSYGYLEFSDIEHGEVFGHFQLPRRDIEDVGSRQWNHKLDLEVRWATHGTQDSIVWQVTTKCPMQINMPARTATTKVPEVVDAMRRSTIKGLGEGCNAGDELEFALSRLYDNVADNVPLPVRVYYVRFIVGTVSKFGS